MITSHNLKTPTNLIRRLRLGGIRIWDVRTPMEFIHGHIEGAENVPVDELDWYIRQPMAEGKTIITCSTGDRRSELVCEELKSRGVDVLDGGDWELLKEVVESIG